VKCPYCASAISDEALACPHCARDIYLFKSLQEKISSLEARLQAKPDAEALVRRVAELEARLAEPIPDIPHQPGQLAALSLHDWAVLWGTPLLLLLCAHALITVVYDFNTLYLRVVSLLIPLPFGLVLTLGGRNGFGASLVAAFGMAMLAVLGMSGLTGLVDHTPLLPQNMREWREFIEYAASVGLSYTTGMVLGKILRNRHEAVRKEAEQGLALRLARVISGGQASAEKLEAIAKKLNDLGGTLTAAGTTAASVYMGLQGTLGRGG
jgi:hypothetical protein